MSRDPLAATLREWDTWRRINAPGPKPYRVTPATPEFLIAIQRATGLNQGWINAYFQGASEQGVEPEYAAFGLIVGRTAPVPDLQQGDRRWAR